jgi:hypothetical protein
MTSGGTSPTSDVATKLDKYWKGVAAVVGMLGLVSAAASWGFSYAMSSRDRQVEELRSDLEKMSFDVKDMRAEQHHMSEKFTENMHDVQIALTAIRTRLKIEDESRSARVAHGNDENHSVLLRRTSPRANPSGSSRRFVVPETEDAVEDYTYAQSVGPEPEQTMELLSDAIERIESRRESPISLPVPPLDHVPVIAQPTQDPPDIPPPASPAL